MFLKRIRNLLGGKLSRWLRLRESRDPEAVYEAAINQRLQRYNQLRSAAAGVIYARNKLANELKEKTARMQVVGEQIEQAADVNEDECALVLLRQKQTLEEDCARLRGELGELTAEAEDAKKSLLGFNGEIASLKAEKIQMLARLKNAQARARVQEAFQQFSQEDDVRALEEVREYIQQTLAGAGVNRELNSASLEGKLARLKQEQAQAGLMAELAEIKRKRRMLVTQDTLGRAADLFAGIRNGSEAAR